MKNGVASGYKVHSAQAASSEYGNEATPLRSQVKGDSERLVDFIYCANTYIRATRADSWLAGFTSLAQLQQVVRGRSYAICAEVL